jgi:hypothetical protein
MVLPFVPRPALILQFPGLEEAKNPSGGEILRLIQIRLATPSLAKILAASQDDSRQARIADCVTIVALSHQTE